MAERDLPIGVWLDGIEPGYRTKIVKHGNATIYINRPILTPEVRDRRERAIVDALAEFGRATGIGKEITA